MANVHQPSHDIVSTDLRVEDTKTTYQHVEHYATTEEMQRIISAGVDPVMRSRADDLPVWQAAKQYKLITTLAMSAAFCASLDGYQISLNGGVVSNKGFIRQMASPGTTIIAAKYVSAWGGVQSAGQFVGQVSLPFATDRFGRKPALLILWAFLVASIFTESFATRWDHWLVAKLLSGMGVGMLQATMPVYLNEMSPPQLRGFLINAYTFWFTVGQLFGNVALNRLNAKNPLAFRTAIYTQWAMIGVMLIIFLLIPETPWWLVGKGKVDQAAKTLEKYNGHISGYDVHEHIKIMAATIAEEKHIAEQNAELRIGAVFQGRNRIRFVIASWPKIVQQLVGLTVFNTYATYFFQAAGNKNPFLVTVILSCCQILAMIAFCLLTDRVGHRPLTVYPYAVTSLSVLALGIVGCFDYKQKATSSLLIFFACLATFTTTGASAIGYAYAAEVPQQRLRAKTAGWALAASNLVGIIFSFCTPLMITGAAKWGVKTGFFFAGTGITATTIAWFILPELTRRTPAEIDEMFEDRVNLRRFKHHVTRVQMHADEAHEKEKRIDSA